MHLKDSLISLSEVSRDIIIDSKLQIIDFSKECVYFQYDFNYDFYYYKSDRVFKFIFKSIDYLTNQLTYEFNLKNEVVYFTSCKQKFVR